MSKVTIQGNASGTGTFTIAAPNSNTDRTFNLPDAAGTVLTTGNQSDFPAGSVLQVVQTLSDATNESTTSTTTFYQIASLNLSITPTSASSKILLMSTVAFGQSRTGDQYGFAYFHFSRDGTAIGVGSATSTAASTMTGASGIDNDFLMGWTGVHLDSPSTTSSVTYGVQTRNGFSSGEGVYINKSSSYPGVAQYYSGVGVSKLIAMEIAG